MEHHALELLRAAEDWKWPNTPRTQLSEHYRSKFAATISPRLLSCVIEQSNKLGGTMLSQFWTVLGTCDPQLNRNIAKLRSKAESVPPEDTLSILMSGIKREDLNFEPVLAMAREIFTHLGVAFMNPGRRKSASGSSHSVEDIVRMETNKLLEFLATDQQFGVRRQTALEILARKRDGRKCPITQMAFVGPTSVNLRLVHPILSHVIPVSFHSKPDTLHLMAMFAGLEVAEFVTENLNSIGNVMNLDPNAHKAFDLLTWGIEAKNVNGVPTYIYREVDTPNPSCVEPEDDGPGPIALRDGDEILFGRGPEGESLGGGPLPLLCNLHLAVARVVRMSGAADAISMLMYDADDSEFPHLYLASKEFCDVLTAKLLLVN